MLQGVDDGVTVHRIRLGVHVRKNMDGSSSCLAV